MWIFLLSKQQCFMQKKVIIIIIFIIIIIMWIFLLSKSETLNRLYAVVRSLTFCMNCGFNLIRLFVINLIVFCIVSATVLCN